MSGAGWVGGLPEAVRRDLYRRALDRGGALLAATAPGPEAAALAAALPGPAWSRVDPEQGLQALWLVGPGEEAPPAPQGCRVEPVSPRRLCVPEGRPEGGSLEAFAAEAGGWVARGEGVALYRATSLELRRQPRDGLRASALRWLLTVLAVPRPDRRLVEALLANLGGAPFTVPEEAPPAPAAPAAAPRPSLEDAALLLGSQLRMLSVPCAPELMEGRLLAAGAVLQRVLASLGLDDLAGPAAEAQAEALRVRSAQPLRQLLVEVLRSWNAEVPEALGPVAPAVAAPAPEAARGEEPARQALKVLKIEPARIEALMDLVGELVVAKNALPFLARRAEQEFDSTELGRAIQAQYGVVNRITEELQGAVMRVRRVPVSEVFRRLPRLVRDLSGKLGKRIRLDLEGEETEADKDVVQDLFDPLMHLVRNSLDHGLEGPEERERAGKPPEGVIRLKAVQHEDQVVIELADDGRGIDPARLRRKAVERGFLTAEAAERLGDEAALQLIFMAGLSTAEQVTDVSGRGVGMDVVRSMVDRVGGTISLHSELGRGTTTTISLPLTMAVSHVMVVEVRGVTLGIPFSSIVETVRVPASELRPLPGGEALVRRGRLVPVCRLARVLDLGEPAAPPDAEALVLARAGGEVVAFVIDEFHQAVDVIVKPLTGVLRGLGRYTGTALLGDGRPLLILDLEQVLG